MNLPGRRRGPMKVRFRPELPRGPRLGLALAGGPGRGTRGASPLARRPKVAFPPSRLPPVFPKRGLRGHPSGPPPLRAPPPRWNPGPGVRRMANCKNVWSGQPLPRGTFPG